MWDQVKQALSESMLHFLTKFASLLPGTAALILAVLISVTVGYVLALVVRKVLAGFQFDQRVARWSGSSVAEWPRMKSPSLLVSRAIGGLIILVGFLIGIAALDTEWTYMLAQSIFAYIPNLVGAALVLVFGTLIARYLARSVLIGAVNMNLQYARHLSVGVKWLIEVLTVAMALEHLKIAPGIVELAFGILFGGIVLAMALAIGLGSRDLVTKSLERDSRKMPSETFEDPLRHL